MDVTLTDEQELLRDTTRRFLEAECPIVAVRQLAEQPDGFDRSFWQRGAELGWTSLLVADDDGGGSVSGDGLADLAIIAEEMGRLVSPGPLVPVNVVAAALSRWGSGEQRAEVLPGLLAGTSVATWALAEPGWRGDPTALTCRAVPADDGFVLTGTKTAVEAGAQAAWFLVAALGPDGPTQFLVPADAPGITVTPLDGIDLVRRHAQVRFDDVPVPTAAVVGEPGTARGALEWQLCVANVLQCAETCGALQRVFDFTLEYLSDRYSFGRPLASYQALKHRVADMKLALEGCHAITAAARRATSSMRSDAIEQASAASAFVGSVATELVQECVQLHGGIGVTWEHDLHLFLRRATLNRATYGTVTDHRRRVAAALGMGAHEGRVAS